MESNNKIIGTNINTYVNIINCVIVVVSFF